MGLCLLGVLSLLSIDGASLQRLLVPTNDSRICRSLRVSSINASVLDLDLLRALAGIVPEAALHLLRCRVVFITWHQDRSEF